MATVEKWTPFGVALDITATAGTVTRTSATKYTVVINVSWETYYSGAKTNYGMSATSGGVTKTISAFGTSRSSGSASFTGTYSVSGNGATIANTKVVFKNFNTDNGDSASKSVALSIKVPAWTSYKVSYNANGGTGAPSAQTKWKDQALAISTIKPTRTGYTFQGWATSSTGAVAYASGASYTSNAGVTLYAVWKANTYTVSYNANGGTGAPSSQTKTYGQTLTLSSTKPTRTNYNFKGWGTSASSTTVSYAAGASYTTNAAITLYAIWELAYVKPRITSYSVTRCDSTGAADTSGTYALVKFNWACDKTVNNIAVYWAVPNIAGTNGIKQITSASGTSGNVNTIIGDGTLNPDYTYTVRVSVTDSGGSTNKDRTLNGNDFLIDCMPENKGIAFGKPSEKEGYADFKFKTYHRDNAEFVNDKAIYGTDTDGTIYNALIPVTASGNLALGYGLYNAGLGTTNLYGNKINFYTKDGVYINGNDLYINNNHVIYGKKPDGTIAEAFNPQNTNGNTVIGWDNYDTKSGSTNVYGYDVLMGVSNIATPGTYKPYYRRGDSVSVNIQTAGYITNSMKEVHFTIPLTKPIVGTPTVSAASGDGFILRQNDKYTHGSSATVYAIPSSYQVYAYHGVGLRIVAVFTNTTNALNNAPIGVHWNGTITFS